MMDGADCSWPSQGELAQIEEIRKVCSGELQKLSDPARDVVGDVRICRFLRFSEGNVKKAAESYREFLSWRVQEGVEKLRSGILELSLEDFLAWLDEVRSPFGPPVCPMLGETPDGHMLVYASPGWFKAAEFVKQRPACHTMDTDLMITWTVLEWMMKQLDDRCYKAQKMLYTVKIIDMKNLGNEKLPIFVSEIRNFAKTNMPQIMSKYCEHDILILVLNAPFVFRMVWAFASALMAKRQARRMRLMADSSSSEAQEFLKSLAPASVWPEAIGGARKAVPLCFPLAFENKERIAKWMATTTPPVVRGQAPVISKTILGMSQEAAKPDGSIAEKQSSTEAPASTPAQVPENEVQPTANANEAPAPASETKEMQPIVMDEGKTEVAPSTGWFCCTSG